MSDDREAEDREAILKRRARLIGVALSGAIASTSATACACLSMIPPDTGVVRSDAGPDGGMDAGEPMPCLTPLPEDAGEPMDAAPEDASPPSDGSPDV